MVQLTQESLHSSLRDPVLEAIETVKEITARFPGVVSFALGSPHPAHLDELDFSAYIDRYLEHLSREHGLGASQARRRLFEYGPSRGLINDLVAAALSLDEGINVAPDGVVITVGAQEALLLALRAIFRSADDLLAVSDPSFYGIIGAARLLDIGIEALHDKGHGVDPAQLDAACRSARADGRRIRALYVAPDFANPSGAIMDLASRYGLLDVAERHDLLLIEDNTYGFTIAPDASLPTLKALDRSGRVIYVGTFAKVCLPGARVGFVVADQVIKDPDGSRRSLADALALVKSMTTVNTAPLCQAMIGGMILAHGGSIAAIGRAKSAVYRRNLGLLLSGLQRRLGSAEGVSWNRPAGGFFVQMRLPVPADMALLERCAAGYGVTWTPLSSFYLRHDGSRHIRLSCSYLDPPQIETGVARLTRFLGDVSPRECAQQGRVRRHQSPVR